MVGGTLSGRFTAIFSTESKQTESRWGAGQPAADHHGAPLTWAHPRRTLGPLLIILLLGLAPGISNAKTLKVAAAGDISCPVELEPTAPRPFHPAVSGTLWCQGAQVADQIAKERADVVLALGDLVQRQEPTFNNLANLKRTWQVVFKRIRPTIGNHDYHSRIQGRAGSDPYFRFWRTHGLGTDTLGKRWQLWATWKRSRVRFISLNSNCNRVACGAKSRQVTWLRSVLKRDRKQGFQGCTVAYFHHPLLSAGHPLGRSMERAGLSVLWRVLHRFRTDLILNGHQHFYERHARMDHRGRPERTGPVQMIAGTGGFSTWNPAGDFGGLLSTSRHSLEATGALILKFGDRTWSSYFRTAQGKKLDPVSSFCQKKP